MMSKLNHKTPTYLSKIIKIDDYINTIELYLNENGVYDVLSDIIRQYMFEEPTQISYSKTIKFTSKGDLSTKFERSDNKGVFTTKLASEGDLSTKFDNITSWINKCRSQFDSNLHRCNMLFIDNTLSITMYNRLFLTSIHDNKLYPLVPSKTIDFENVILSCCIISKQQQLIIHHKDNSMINVCIYDFNMQMTIDIKSVTDTINDKYGNDNILIHDAKIKCFNNEIYISIRTLYCNDIYVFDRETYIMNRSYCIENSYYKSEMYVCNNQIFILNQERHSINAYNIKDGTLVYETTIIDSKFNTNNFIRNFQLSNSYVYMTYTHRVTGYTDKIIMYDSKLNITNKDKMTEWFSYISTFQTSKIIDYLVTDKYVFIVNDKYKLVVYDRAY
jgi:hypothetical protein